jgi:hypothetical protein
MAKPMRAVLELYSDMDVPRLSEETKMIGLERALRNLGHVLSHLPNDTREHSVRLSEELASTLKQLRELNACSRHDSELQGSVVTLCMEEINDLRYGDSPADDMDETAWWPELTVVVRFVSQVRRTISAVEQC